MFTPFGINHLRRHFIAPLQLAKQSATQENKAHHVMQGFFGTAYVCFADTTFVLTLTGITHC